MKLEVSGQIFEKKIEISNFMRICPVCAELYVDGQTNVTKLPVVFSNLANALKNAFSSYICLFIPPCLTVGNFMSVTDRWS